LQFRFDRAEDVVPEISLPEVKHRCT